MTGFVPPRDTSHMPWISERVEERQEKVVTALRWALGGLSVFFILLFFYTALRRLHYPFELERMESGVLTSAWRVAHGKPLYAQPSLEWAAYLYTPVYFYVSAAIMKLTGAGYQATRLVSVLSVAGLLATIYTFVFGEVRRHLPALAAAGLYAALYASLGCWYDLGRVDSLVTFLLIAALLATRYLHPAVAAILWVAVFQTKQGFLPLPLVVFLFEWQRPRRMLVGMATYVALAAGSIAWMQHVSHGWYSFYVFGVPTQLKFLWRSAVLYVPRDLLAVVGLAILLVIASAMLGQKTYFPVKNRKFCFYLLTSVLLYGLIGFVRSHGGASENSLFPAYAWTAVLFGIALERLLRWSETLEHARNQRFALIAVLLMACVQLTMHLYNPGDYIPYPGKLAARQAFLEQLRHAPGDVWVLTHSWDAVLTGKPLHPEMDAFDAVLVRPVNDQTRPVVEALRDAYANQRLSAVIVDYDPLEYVKGTGFGTPLFRQHYGMHIRAEGSGSAHLEDQPRYILAPCDADKLPGDPWHTRTAFIDRSGCK